MWDINTNIKDTTEKLGSVTILLNSDKPLSPYHISYPISWKGFVNNNPVEIIQFDSSSQFLEDYEFKTFPISNYLHQNTIINLIDNCLRKALD